ETGNIAYNIPGAYVFEGQLDRQALELSFSSLIDRHEILRTVFREDEHGEVRQFILPSMDFRVYYLDLRGNKDHLPFLLKQDHSVSFYLENGPLMRATLYQLQDNKWVFSFVMHHIISDGWSIGVLISDLLHVYNSAVKQEDITLPSLRIQYKDYAHWQQQQLSGKIQE
ncbi:condensation domain-containing protein, partial [Niastella koreensis]